MKTIVISAGRNVGSRPMAAEEWQRLRLAVARILESVDASVHTRDAIGSGEWLGDDGVLVREESVTYSATVQDGALQILERNLQEIAKQFKQEAIALIVGRSVLVRG